MINYLKTRSLEWWGYAMVFAIIAIILELLYVIREGII